MSFIALNALESSFAGPLLILGLAFWMPTLFDREQTLHRSMVFAVAGGLALRYLWWRATDTLAPFGPSWDCLASWSLFAIEGLSIIGSISSFVMLSRTRDRSLEADAHLEWWRPGPPPRVAILIATYNEDLEVLERTIVGARALRHTNKEVVVLDDGRRDWLREYCVALGVRYLRRDTNAGSKAGNINNALSVLATDPVPPDYIAVLDADFVPHRGFLNRSLALFHDAAVGLVQTPQHFFNADPVQHNLVLSRSYPDEQRLFFDHLQPARDGWDIAFCCGTSSIIRWSALRDIGGFPTESITEDFMGTLVLRDHGWKSVYLNEPLTEGLAPEGLKEYVSQRARWCLGMMQIARSRVGPLARNRLRLRDRWSVLDAGLYWLSTYLFRLAALSFPLLYWYFDIIVVNAQVPEVISYFGTYYLWVLVAMNMVAPGMVVPVINDVSQILGAIPIARAAVVGLLRPHGHPFKVTAKGGDRSRVVVQWRMLMPYLALLTLTLLGLALGIFFDGYAFDRAGSGKAIVLFWTLYNVLVLLVTLITFVELPRQEMHVNDRPERGIFAAADGAQRVWLTGLTQTAVRLRGRIYQPGETGVLRIRDVGDVEARVSAATRDGAILQLTFGPDQSEALMLRLYTDGGRPGVAHARMAALVRDAAYRLSNLTRMS